MASGIEQHIDFIDRIVHNESEIYLYFRYLDMLRRVSIIIDNYLLSIVIRPRLDQILPGGAGGVGAEDGLTGDVRDEARIIERSFGIGPTTLTEAAALLDNTSNIWPHEGDHHKRKMPSRSQSESLR